MTNAETVARNDALRTKCRGGIIVMSPSVLALPDWFRGRALIRLSMPHKYINEDHSEGQFVFGGWHFYWRITDYEQLTLSLYMAEDF